jgi:hypothetical protein
MFRFLRKNVDKFHILRIFLLSGGGEDVLPAWQPVPLVEAINPLVKDPLGAHGHRAATMGGSCILFRKESATEVIKKSK